MVSLGERFEAKVDRTGEHHLWIGSKKADGTGKLKVEGKAVTAARVAWELAHGALPAGAEVRACPEARACVRIEHLSVRGNADASAAGQAGRRRARKGTGSITWVREGACKLTVTAGRYDDGSPRRLSETVEVDGEVEAVHALARYVSEINDGLLPATKFDRDIVLNDAIERYLDEYLRDEKGRAPATLRNYRRFHNTWFKPELGKKRVRDITEADMDRIAGKIRRAGRSTSRLQDVRNLYAPFFRWAKRRGIVRRSPMAEFDVPTSLYIPQEHVPPEVEQLCLYLTAAVQVVPDVAPVLTFGAVTGMRRGELVTVQRSGLVPGELKLRIYAPKTRRAREVAVDAETMAMLLRHCALMDERAATQGITVGPDAYVFSLEPDCSKPMSPDHLTKQVAKLKEFLGIANKRPDTVALEDRALVLRRQKPPARPKGRPGPLPAGGMSYEGIGRQLGRSPKWAYNAVAAAKRREDAYRRGIGEFFDGSVVALRKFTSSELLDAGFNINIVAKRQGHGPQVLVKHYSKARRSADRKAADFLGNVVHGATVNAATYNPHA
jgi:integrase